MKRGKFLVAVIMTSSFLGLGLGLAPYKAFAIEIEKRDFNFNDLKKFHEVKIQEQREVQSLKRPLEKPVGSLSNIIQGMPEVVPQECHSAFTENLGLENYNLGVVKNNDFFQIYRSAALGKGLETVINRIQERGYKKPKTVIYLHEEDRRFRGQEEKIAGTKSLNFFWSKEDSLQGEPSPSSAIKEGDKNVDNIARIVEIVLNPTSQPVLFHCIGGRHRTGMIALVLRYLEGGCWTDDSLTKKVWVRNKFIRMNRAQYEYYTFNKTLFREENLKFVIEFTKNPIFKNLQLKYGEKLILANKDRELLSRHLDTCLPGHTTLGYFRDMAKFIKYLKP